MTVTFDLPADLEETLRQSAARSGQDIGTFVLQAVQERIARGQTLDEICQPFVQAVEASGMADDDFDRFFGEVREEVWRERHSGGP